MIYFFWQQSLECTKIERKNLSKERVTVGFDCIFKNLAICQPKYGQIIRLLVFKILGEFLTAPYMASF